MEFNSINDLYIRVTPALKTRVNDFINFGIKNITEKDIFNYLSISKWKDSIDLSLAQIVADILNCNAKEINDFKIGG